MFREFASLVIKIKILLDIQVEVNFFQFPSFLKGNLIKPVLLKLLKKIYK